MSPAVFVPVGHVYLSTWGSRVPRGRDLLEESLGVCFHLGALLGAQMCCTWGRARPGGSGRPSHASSGRPPGDRPQAPGRAPSCRLFLLYPGLLGPWLPTPPRISPQRLTPWVPSFPLGAGPLGHLSSHLALGLSPSPHLLPRSPHPCALPGTAFRMTTVGSGTGSRSPNSPATDTRPAPLPPTPERSDRWPKAAQQGPVFGPLLPAQASWPCFFLSSFGFFQPVRAHRPDVLWWGGAAALTAPAHCPPCLGSP